MRTFKVDGLVKKEHAWLEYQLWLVQQLREIGDANVTLQMSCIKNKEEGTWTITASLT